jgi:hypothetical protein
VPVVLADWRENLNEDVFAAWFEDIYLNDDWATDLSMRVLEACRVSLRTTSATRAYSDPLSALSGLWLRWNSFGAPVPELLQHESLHFAHDIVNRGAEDQLARVQTGHIHRDILEKAMMYLNHADKNILMVCTSVLILSCINTNMNCHR